MRHTSFTGLLPILVSLTVISCTSDPIAPETTPGLKLLEHSELKRSSVILKASPDASDINITECGFIIGKSYDLGSDAAKHPITNYAGGEMSLEISGLDPGTTYYYKAYFTDGRRTKTTAANSFTTLTQSTALIADFKLVGNTLSATISDNGGRPVKHVGFCWSTTENPDIFGNSKEVEFSGTSFSLPLPDVDINKDYYFRAFADNGTDGNNAIAYSSEQVTYRKDEEYQIVLSSSEIVASQESGTIEIVVQSNIEFTVINPDVDWIHPIETKALETHRLTYLVDSNDSYDERYAEITIVSELLEKSETVSIKQVQKDAIVVALDSYDLTAAAGTIDVDISSNVEFTVKSTADWIAQDITTKALSSEKLSFTIAENQTDDPREGQIVINASSSDISQTITVRQERGPARINIPDANFKAYLVENFDKNGDGEISALEAEAVTHLSVSTREIKSLEGIGYFINLQWLVCTPKYVSTTGDLDGNFKLFDENGQEVYGSLSELNLENNIRLTHLNCSGNPIPSLDVSCCSALENLNCSFCKISELNTDGCQYVNQLLCRFNPLDKINVSGMTNLTYLDVGYCNLKSLDLSDNINLNHLDCGANNISELDISNNPKLTSLSCQFNDISQLDVRNLSGLTDLLCSANRISALDVTCNTLLSDLVCSSNNLKSLDLSKNSKLRWLHCGSNELNSLDLSNKPELTNLECASSNLNSLDLSNNPKLTDLRCGSNNLNSLDLSFNLKLTSVDCRYCQSLTELWLKTGQTIENLNKDSHTEVKYK
ncbi:MAG: BACON domain-containing carbohydrate-binding protein [Bacteroidales bacterium]|nr:BACON domain-containing carbohydrate-binding protein [Bacteroidales bacterium]